MSQYTFDTSFIITNNLSDFPDSFLFSDVVLLELTAAAQDESYFKALQELRKFYYRKDLLITPSGDDWLMASKVLYWLEKGAKRKNRGKSLRKMPGATQRMALDALIAVSARRRKVTVVTENFDHFDAIRYYCPFKLMKGLDFLNLK